MTKSLYNVVTGGKGLWSNRITNLPVLDISLLSTYDGEGELRVFFDGVDWDVDRDGFIYTDPVFLKNLQKLLRSQGLPAKEIEYSEYNMQGRFFVSLDVSSKFVEAWKAAGRYIEND